MSAEGVEVAEPHEYVDVPVREYSCFKPNCFDGRKCSCAILSMRVRGPFVQCKPWQVNRHILFIVIRRWYFFDQYGCLMVDLTTRDCDYRLPLIFLKFDCEGGVPSDRAAWGVAQTRLRGMGEPLAGTIVAMPEIARAYERHQRERARRSGVPAKAGVLRFGGGEWRSSG